MSFILNLIVWHFFTRAFRAGHVVVALGLGLGPAGLDNSKEIFFNPIWPGSGQIALFRKDDPVVAEKLFCRKVSLNAMSSEFYVAHVWKFQRNY